MKTTQTVLCPEEIPENIPDQIMAPLTWNEVFDLEKEAINSWTSSEVHHHIYL